MQTPTSPLCWLYPSGANPFADYIPQVLIPTSPLCWLYPSGANSHLTLCWLYPSGANPFADYIPQVLTPLLTISLRCAVGHADRHDRRVPPQGAGSTTASHLHQSHPCGPPGPEEYLRLPRLQDQVARTHLRLDLQPQVQREAFQVDARRRGSSSASLGWNPQ